jgi:hypothetical protein
LWIQLYVLILCSILAEEDSDENAADNHSNPDSELFGQNGEKLDFSQILWQSRLRMLKKDLEKEIQVKEGLDRLLAAHATSATKNAYYSVQETGVIADTKAKIAALRMQIDQIQLKLNGDRG